MKILRTLVLILSFAALANAQKTVLTGTIYDDYGAVIGNAKASIRGKDNFEKIIFTDENGIFEGNLNAGNHSIEVSSAGFQTFKLEKYRIAPSYKGKLNLDIVLEVRICDGCGQILSDPIDKNKKPK